MSIVRVFFNPLDASSMVTHDVEAGVQIIDFLQAEYPVGFNGCIRTFAGVHEIQPDDLDYVIQDEEQITILVMPATVGAVVGYVIQALVAVAIGYVINLIFAPSNPDGMNGPEESPVYSLSPTRNQARLGQPIECNYGTVSLKQRTTGRSASLPGSGQVHH